MTRLALSVFGALQMTLDGQPVTGFESSKVRALLVYLALEADRPHSRDSLADLLWPDQPDRAARGNLRQTLANLRQAIGDRESEERAFLHVTRDTVQFNLSSDCWLDSTAFVDLLARCDRHPHRHAEVCRACAGLRQQAVDLYRGDFLDQFFLNDSAVFEEWALVKRESLRRRALDALYRLAEYHERRGAYELALRSAIRQLEFDPWREEAHRQAMRALAMGGQRSAALAQFETCWRVLNEEMKAEPSEETVILYQKIAKDQISGFSGTHPSLLPVPPTTFVGRGKEQAELGELLCNPACRLISIVGPGGIGKSRLALEAANENLSEFADGGAFVPLSSLGSAELIAPAIMGALGLHLQGQREPKDQLIAYLRTREVLLALDNLEHLVQGGRELLSELLERAPRVTCLVTSRERLAIPSERLFDLHGLNYPTAAAAEPTAYAAFELFVQRARQVQRQFALTEANTRAIMRICQMVQGMPLGIELAAAATRAYSCDLIATALETNLRTPAATLRDIPERHRSMWATFEYSWNLLSAEEQRFFRQLSVFRGGFQEGAAAAVTGAAPAILSALVDKSLVRRRAAGRYDVHELVRQYTAEKLAEAGEVQQASERHLACFFALAQEAEPQLIGMAQPIWLTRLDEENDNLRAALQWALDQGNPGMAARIITAIWRFWFVRGHFVEARRWAALVLAQRSKLAPSLQTRMLAVGGVFARLQGDFRQAKALYEESLALRRDQGDKQGIASSLNNLGIVAQIQGDLARGRTLLEECLALWREVGDAANIPVVLQNLGLNLVYSGDSQRATSVLEQALELRQQRGDGWGIAAALSGLGDVQFYQGNYARAEEIYVEALSKLRELEDRGAVVGVLASLGNIARHQDDYERAQALYAEALTLGLELGQRRELASTLSGLAALAITRRQPDRAAVLFAAAEKLLEEMDAVPWPVDRAEYDPSIAAARARLGEARFAAAWAEGRALTMEQAVAYALAGARLAPSDGRSLAGTIDEQSPTDT